MDKNAIWPFLSSYNSKNIYKESKQNVNFKKMTAIKKLEYEKLFQRTMFDV